MDFWQGFVIGWLAFVPSVWLLWILWAATAGQIEQPGIGFGRNHALHWFGRHKDLEQSLAFLRQVGFDHRHLRGKWYWCWRTYYPKGRPTERLADWLVYRIMDAAAWLDKRTWSAQHLEWRIYRYREFDDRILGMYCYCGWRPARYV